jgi:hypothetical protein
LFAPCGREQRARVVSFGRLQFRASGIRLFTATRAGLGHALFSERIAEADASDLFDNPFLHFRSFRNHVVELFGTLSEAVQSAGAIVAIVGHVNPNRRVASLRVSNRDSQF